MVRKLSIVLFILLISSPWVLAENRPKNLPNEAETLIQKAIELYNTGRYEEAIPYAKRSLEITENVLGNNHIAITAILNDLAMLYFSTWRHSEAELLLKRSLEIRERLLGKDHLDVAQTLNHLASVYSATGRYTEAEQLYKRSLEIKERVFGKDHPDVALILNNLAMLYFFMGRYGEAELLLNRSLEIGERLLGKDHLNVAFTLNDLGMLYFSMGRYSEAEPMLKRSLDIRERVMGKDHPQVAQSLYSLAILYSTTGRYKGVESLLKRSLQIRESLLGKDHPDVAQNLNSLGMIYFHAGRYEEAEPLLKRSLDIRERVMGKDHPDIALILNDLAMLYFFTGRHSEAEPLLKRSLDIRERVLGKDHPYLAQTLNNLAILYSKAGRYAEAEPLFNRSLEIGESLSIKDHPDIIITLNNLAILYSLTGRNTEAELGLKRSLEIGQRLFSKDQSSLALTLNDLAMLYFSTKRYKEAEPLLKKSLEIRKRVLGQNHTSVAISLINLSLLYGATDRHLESHRLFTRGIGIEEKEKRNIFLLLSEKQKIGYVEEKKWNIYRFVTHTAKYMKTYDPAVVETFDAWLKWKGGVMEAQGRYIDALTYSKDFRARKIFEELNSIRREICKLQTFSPRVMNVEEYRKRLEELERKKGSLEVELGRLSKDFTLEKMIGRADSKSISEIFRRKGENSVYIDFANIHTYDFKGNKFGKPRYLAFILLPDKEPVVKLIDISNTEGIDNHIKAYLEEMRRAKEFRDLPRERILKAEAKALYELLLKPIEKEIKGKKHLYISPDGNLNLIPFEVLMTPKGKYLMEDYNITYIAAGRDIIRFEDTNVAKGEPVIMADPDYDMGLQEKTQVAEAMGVVETRGPAPISRDGKDLRFKRLPDTKQEADAIEKVLKQTHKINVKNYQDKKALEEVLFNARDPRILHLATHGYFLKDEEVKHQLIMTSMSQGKEVFVDLGIENPMLRSGIVLAGANASLKEGRDDGVVSAEKILGLRLKGTELVVLSACDTGTGEVKSGEGVFGLKRSFILSGAKTVVMSLWSITSKETTELMIDFYTLMANGKTKAESLREAKLNLMKKKSNPLYWGAFIMVGNSN